MSARLVAVGRICAQVATVDIDPTFGSDDEWQSIMAMAVDATPEVVVLSDSDIEEHYQDYHDWLCEVNWLRRGGA